ncbi:MAG: hypothetical protein ACI9J2_001282 [Saprospiraceae bacterium]|jgi:hypothetical protein
METSLDKKPKRETIETLLRQNPQLWRGKSRIEHASPQAQFLGTGYKSLDKVLPGGGWPQGSVIEVVVSSWGQGELSILLPLMAILSQNQQPIVFIAPPYMPYAPAMQAAKVDLQHLWVIEKGIEAKDEAWAAEKILATAQGALVLVFAQLTAKQIRRLQVAASLGLSLGVLVRCGKAVQTPVSLRLGLTYQDKGLQVDILKARQLPKDPSEVAGQAGPLLLKI